MSLNFFIHGKIQNTSSAFSKNTKKKQAINNLIHVNLPNRTK